MGCCFSSGFVLHVAEGGGGPGLPSPVDGAKGGLCHSPSWCSGRMAMIMMVCSCCCCCCLSFSCVLSMFRLLWSAVADAVAACAFVCCLCSACCGHAGRSVPSRQPVLPFTRSQNYLVEGIGQHEAYRCLRNKQPRHWRAILSRNTPHPQLNVDELCEEWQVLAKKTAIQCITHGTRPSTTLSEGCGAQSSQRMEQSEMAVFFANTGLGLESHRVDVMSQSCVLSRLEFCSLGALCRRRVTLCQPAS